MRDRTTAGRLLSESLATWGRTTLAVLLRPFRLPDPLSEAFPGPLTVAVVNLFLSLALNALLLRSALPRLFEAVLFLLSFWLVYILVLHGACRLLRGKALWEETLGRCSQAIAAVYLMTSLLALVTSLLVAVTGVSASQVPVLGDPFVWDPASGFCFAGSFGLLLDLPFCLKPLHRLGGLRTAAVLLVPLVLIRISLSGCLPPPSSHRSVVVSILLPECLCEAPADPDVPGR